MAGTGSLAETTHSNEIFSPAFRTLAERSPALIEYVPPHFRLSWMRQSNGSAASTRTSGPFAPDGNETN